VRPKKPAPKPEPLSKRRRYETKSGEPDLEKIIADLKVYIAMHRYVQHLPTPRELIRDDYWNLGWAMRKLSYMEVVAASGLPPQPNYFQREENLPWEIDRVFMDPQNVGHENDEDFETVFPSLEQLKAHAEIYAGVVAVGGLGEMYPPDRQYSPLPGEYFNDLSNLKAEIGIVMKRLRGKMLPTYKQLGEDRRRLIDAYLFHGGYPSTAAKLEMPFNSKYLDEPENLKWELQIVDIHQARKDGDRILPNGLPDCWLSYVPTEKEIKAASRPDLHKAIIDKYGGYFHVAEALGFWHYSKFWQDNPSLRREMKNVARYILKRPKLMPTKEDLAEIGRPDLAKAIDHNGGYRKAAEFCGLEPQKPSRSVERALPSAKGGFVPYPFRRIDPKLKTKVDGVELAFEVPTDLGKDSPTEYGIWILTGNSTSGRIGRIRLKLRHADEWLFRLEGESSWRGQFDEYRKTPVLQKLLKESGVVP